MASLREALEGAIDGTPATDESVSTPQGEVVAEATEVDTPLDTPLDTPAPEDSGQVRDALGRFVPKAGAGETPPPVAAAPAAPAAPATPAAPTAPAQAPQSWKPEVKAEWAKLPPVVQAEVTRREGEIQAALTQTGYARNIAQAFTDMTTPYLPFIRAEGVQNPLDAYRGLMDTHVALRTGSQYQKATKLAELVKYYGVDIGELDSALAGTATENPNDVMQRQIDQRVAQQMQPFQQIVQQAQQAQQASYNASAQEVATELSTFAAAHPHYETVRTWMADAMQLAQQRGENLSLADAYNWAIALHPATKGATMAAQTQQTAAQLNAAAQRAKRASTGSSRIPAASSAVPAGGANKSGSLRDAIANAMQDVPVAH